MAYTKYSLTPANNTSAPPDGAPEGMLPSAVNDTMRDMMAQIRDCGDGVRDGTYTMTAPKITGGTITGVTLTGNTFSSPVISGGTINNATIGATTATTGKFTTLTNSALTSGRVTYAGASGLLSDSANLTYNGTALSASASSAISGVFNRNTSSGAALEIQVVGGSVGTLGSDTGGNGIFDIAAASSMFLRSTGASSIMAFSTNNTEVMRILANGNVGIGTTSPDTPLQVNGTIKSYTPSVSNSNFLLRNSTTGDALGFNIQQDGVNTYIYNGSNGLMAFATNNTERMRIDSSGNLLLSGTVAATTTGGMTITNTSSGSSSTPLALRNVGTANGSGVQISFRGVTNASAENDYAYFNMVADDTTAKTGSMRFSTANGSSPVERMRIDSSGNLEVGTTLANSGIKLFPSFSSSGSSGININHVSTSASGEYYVVFQYNASVIGYISQNGTTAVAYNTTSDYRLKQNIEPMTGALATVAQLKPVTYKWKTDGLDGQGFIAHELQAVVPDCVTGEKDAVDADGKPVYQGVDTSFLVATLTKAIQEQQALIESLTTRLTALENK
jgi:hypothetical protein